MNQKNIFTVIGAVLVLQGIVFYFIRGKIVMEAFPNLDEVGQNAAKDLVQVICLMGITLGLVSFATRNAPQVLWAYTIGFGLVSLNSLKHFFIDQIDVPMPALIIQTGIAIACAYLWMQSKKAPAN